MTARRDRAGLVAVAGLVLMALALLAALALLPDEAIGFSKLWLVCPAGPPDCDFASVNAAANAGFVSAGDGIGVEAGTYTEQVNVSKTLSITGAGNGPPPVITSAANGPTITLASGSAALRSCCHTSPSV